MEAQTNRASGLDLRAEQITTSVGEHVVMIGGRGAAGSRQARAAVAAVRVMSSSRLAHTGYSVVSHSNNVPSTARPRVTHW
jgi:hypothetical protein